MKRVALLMMVAACSEPSTHSKIPGASIAPALARPAPHMCGFDIDWGADQSIDVRYRFALDEFGRLSHGTAVYAAHRPDDTIEYEWDNLDRFVHYVQTTGTGARYETSAIYNSLGDLLEYSTLQPGSAQHYTYSAFSEAGQPMRELVDANRAITALSLEYDAWSRIVRVAPPSGAPTIYSYDDDARTTIVDTNNGEYHGVITYDDSGRELSEIWTADGSTTEDHYDYDGDRVASHTHREPAGVSVETYRYSDCR